MDFVAAVVLREQPLLQDGGQWVAPYVVAPSQGAEWHSSSHTNVFRELPCARAQHRKTRPALQNGQGQTLHHLSRLPFNTGPSLKLSIMLVGVMPIFRHMLKVPNAGPLSVGSFGHIGIIEIGIC